MRRCAPRIWAVPSGRWLQGRRLSSSACVGISIRSASGVDVVELVRQADAAMHEANAVGESAPCCSMRTARKNSSDAAVCDANSSTGYRPPGWTPWRCRAREIPVSRIAIRPPVADAGGGQVARPRADQGRHVSPRFSAGSPRHGASGSPRVSRTKAEKVIADRAASSACRRLMPAILSPRPCPTP